MPYQRALTVVAPVRAGARGELESLIATMGNGVANGSVLDFGALSGVHFARLAVVEEDQGLPAHLILMTDFDVPQEVETLFTGDWATKGFLTRSDTGETVLYGSKAAGKTRDLYVIASGIECVTLPCPIWALYTADGAPLGNAARLDLSFMLLSDAETAALHDKLLQSGGIVRGYINQASWARGSGPTLLVADLFDLAP